MRSKLQALTAIYLKLAALAVAVGALTRIALLFSAQTVELGFSAVEWLEIFLLGAVNDLCALTLGFGFMLLYLVSISERKYARPTGYVLLGLLAAALLYTLCFNTIFDEYGSAAPAVAKGVLAFWIASFALRLFVPRIRPAWSKGWFTVLAALYVGAILLNAACEIVFWSEFGVRYNFIAVDYLVYTHEVIGNIIESYPIVWMTLGLLAVTGAVTWLLFRRELTAPLAFAGAGWKAAALPAYAVAAVAAYGLMHFNVRFQDRPNVYVNELQANGAYKFCDAFVKNELAYRQFYLTLPEAEATAILAAEYGSSDRTNRHAVTAESAEGEQHPNIVLITLESMSADFLAHYGNREALTPNLDALFDESLVFDNIFATGNRTVRGLEAVTLSLPPCPGQSVVKRKHNSGLHTTASVLRDKGYTTTYFYGGNAYFDNMEAFFGGNGYEIVDQKCYTPGEITFANIWGVCDEDSYTKALHVLTEKVTSGGGRPFFAHIMSVSNHRPYTYPEGRIPIPSDSKRRAGGVMYSDYALGRFLTEARRQPWFENTVFLITADHCASSAGKTEIPLEKYHIPALIFAPGRIAPARVGKVASQIDLIPTLFALLGMSYEAPFYGKDILADDFRERAFIATYQDLGYLEGEIFTVLSPVRRMEQYRRTPTAENPYAVERLTTVDDRQRQRAIAFYQSSSETTEAAGKQDTGSIKTAAR